MITNTRKVVTTVNVTGFAISIVFSLNFGKLSEMVKPIKHGTTTIKILRNSNLNGIWIEALSIRTEPRVYNQAGNIT